MTWIRALLVTILTISILDLLNSVFMIALNLATIMTVKCKIALHVTHIAKTVQNTLNTTAHRVNRIIKQLCQESFVLISLAVNQLKLLKQLTSNVSHANLHAKHAKEMPQVVLPV